MRRLTLACVATVAVADYLIERRDPPWLVVGLLDEPAHLATALLLNPNPGPAYLAGALLPDLDHVPLAFGNPVPGDPRPMTHSLGMLLPAALISREMAAGVLAHYARDLALGPGLPLLWPLGRRTVRVPYAAYAALLSGAAARRRRPG